MLRCVNALPSCAAHVAIWVGTSDSGLSRDIAMMHPATDNSSIGRALPPPSLRSRRTSSRVRAVKGTGA